ncbi:cytochrome P450 734A1-like [Impatiens glandulifera]|uniref:cytochrome P450 734A1-like n=1 Tax=Impatiens glandulifera TaxID=253017 RepID=UPI001FB171B4|nr:cytochrome P450 734A1-like [Impatiens glandulifera]
MDGFYIVLYLLAAAVVVFKITAVLWWRPKKIEHHFSKQGIRGPPYRFFIGNAKELFTLMSKASSQPMPLCHNILPRVLSFYHHWKKIYGGTFLVWFGPTVRLAVSDPDLIREIFTSKNEYYEKIEAHPLIKQLEGDGLLSLKGQKWAHHRRIITPTFHMDNLKLLIPLVGKSVVEMLDNLVDKDREIEIEVSEWYQKLTEEVVTRAAFGCSYDHGKDIFRLQAQQMALATQAFQKVSLPVYRFLPTKRNMKSWKLDKEIKKSLEDVINQRREKIMADGGGGDVPKDLLGLMIEASLKESAAAPAAARVTVGDIAEECKSFFFAGEQTTTNLLTWTTVLLAMHPNWQDQARDEVLKVCGPRDVPSKDDIPKLKKLSMILNESLRLYPPAVATIRRAKVDVELGGFKIPKGTEILIPILAVHHDQAIWGQDANEFNPTRFTDGVVHAAKHPVAFIPFGLGLRKCIGQNLAILQAKLTLAIILKRMSFRLAPQYRHAPTVLMLLHPQHGAPVIFKHLSTHDERARSILSSAHGFV